MDNADGKPGDNGSGSDRKKRTRTALERAEINAQKAADKLVADNFQNQRHSVEKQKERHAFLLSYLAQPDRDEGLLLEDGQPVSVKPRTSHRRHSG